MVHNEVNRSGATSINTIIATAQWSDKQAVLFVWAEPQAKAQFLI